MSHQNSNQNDSREQEVVSQKRFDRMYGKMDERVRDLEALVTNQQEEIEALRAQLETQRRRRNSTKIDEAKRIARNEVLRQVEKHQNATAAHGGSVDIPSIVQMARPDLEIQYKTAEDAVKELAAEWRCFDWREGSGERNGENKRLVVVTPETIPDTLWRAYRDDRRREEGE